MDGAARTIEPVAALLALASGVLLFGAIFFGGDAGDSSVLWVGGAAIVLAVACLSLRSLGLIGLPVLDGPGRVALAGFGSLVAWTGISIAWSVAGDHSWAALNKGIAYSGFVVVGLALCSLGTRTTQTVAGLLAGTLGAALLWALAGKAIPTLGPSDLLGVVRLRSPVGYANGLALLGDVAVALALWLALARRSALRTAGSLLLYVAVLAVLLTSSRAGAIGALVALGMSLWLGRGQRLQGALIAVGAGVPAVAVAGWAFTRPALVDTGVAHSGRVHDGAIFGVLALVGAGLAVGAPRWLARLVAGREQPTGWLLAGAAVLAVAAGVALAAGSSSFSGGECVNDPSHVGSLCANNRLHWWREAVRIFDDRPVGGAGAGTFEIARTQVRRNADVVTEPHSVPLQVLAGTGIVGAALLAVLVAGAGLGIALSLRRLEGEERTAAVALTAFPVVYSVHALVDFDLDFVALTGPALLVTGVVLGVGRPLRRGGGLLPLLVVAGVAVAAIASLGSPWLALRGADSARRAFESGRLAEATRDANRARSLNPLLPDPLYTLGEAATRAGDITAARDRFLQATRLQPENTQTWYQLGVFEFYGSRDLCAAYTAFNHAYTLDPNGSEWVKNGLLDQARDAVNNDRACD